MAHLLGMNLRRRLAALAVTLAAAATATSLAACRPTTHATAPSALGVARPSSELDVIVDEPGPVHVETVVGADWHVPRSGLINLDHPKAKEAHLVDGEEPIVVPFHVLRHPTQGLFIIDTGVERALRDDPGHAALSGLAASYLGVGEMRVKTDTHAWIASQKEPLKGVFLTHLHLDHVSGMRDVPNDAIVYAGPGETSSRSFLNAFIQGPLDASLEGKGDLREWQFAPEKDPTSAAFEGVIDVFGDRSVWAIHVPGHTPGSTAYLARTPDGPVLFTGDASHTTWGWVNGVEPGSYSEDRPKSAESLARLRAFVAKHPRIEVRVGHQLKANANAPLVARP
jgi:N-acyl homoserine lactone hydrolase